MAEWTESEDQVIRDFGYLMPSASLSYLLHGRHSDRAIEKRKMRLGIVIRLSQSQIREAFQLWGKLTRPSWEENEILAQSMGIHPVALWKMWRSQITESDIR